MNSCAGYDDCIAKTMDTLRYPMDKRSLYRYRIYDKQTANRRCYESNPINILEGFGSTELTLTNILKWLIVIVIIYLIYVLVTDKHAIKEVKTALGGASESLSDLSFLKTE
jgi:hypothetical protein